jgi:hypothetical protein
MKTQKTIVKAYKDGKMITFERFSYMRPSTILKHYRSSYNDATGLLKWFFKDYEKADYILIVPTPDGYTEDTENIIKMSPAEFLTGEA